ncbi:MAG: site-specific integrase [Pseudomonadota bacterium]
MSLTDVQIRRLKIPAKGQKTYFDKSLPGFGVRVSQGGSKTFIALCGPARKRHSLGRYPDMSLATARAHAKKVQAEYALDSPISASRPTMTFEVARDMFLADSQRRNRPRTFVEYRRHLRTHFPFKELLNDVDRHQIVRALDKIKDKPSEKKHAFVALRTMMNWCRKRGYLDFSPVPPLTFKETTRDRILSADELRAVWWRAEEFDYPFGAIVKLLILTGQRRGEITALRRSWLTDELICFPADAVKNGRKHFLPLSDMTRNLVSELPERTDLLFPARGKDDSPFNGFSAAKKKFDRDLNIAPYNLHDLRRTFSSNMAKLGTPIHVTEKILNHVSGTISGVAAIYNRYSYQDEMRQALAAHEGYLRAILDQQLQSDQHSLSLREIEEPTF